MKTIGMKNISVARLALAILATLILEILKTLRSFLIVIAILIAIAQPNMASSILVFFAIVFIICIFLCAITDNT